MSTTDVQILLSVVLAVVVIAVLAVALILVRRRLEADQPRPSVDPRQAEWPP